MRIRRLSLCLSQGPWRSMVGRTKSIRVLDVRDQCGVSVEEDMGSE